jgi:hypothetical protein
VAGGAAGMTDQEQSAVLDRLQRPTTIGGYEGTTRVLQTVEQAANYGRGQRVAGASLVAAKKVAMEVALIAAGGLDALGRAPECKNWLGPPTERPHDVLQAARQLHRRDLHNAVPVFKAGVWMYGPVRQLCGIARRVVADVLTKCVMALRISPRRRLHLSPADPHTGLEARIARRSPAFFALKQHLACGPLSPWPLQPACANWRFYSASPPEYPSPSSARLVATKRHSRRFCLTRVLPGMAAELAKPPTRQLPLPLPAGAKLPTFLRMPARRRQPHRPALQRGVANRACGTVCAKIHL